MTIDIHSKDGQIIRQLIPLSTISTNQFESLCNKITIEEAESGTYLFKKNDKTNDLIYLIDGSVTLQSNKLKVETIKSGSESSRFAIAHQIPRKIDAFTNTSIRFLRLNIDIIDALQSITYEEDYSYMVSDQHNEDEEEENDDDWMTTLLKSPIFRALPPANLQKIIMSLEEVVFDQGELIVKQGDPGDYYYLIKDGQCLLSRKPAPNAKEIKLGRLQNQDTFGEDALLSGEPRNVNITALTHISLLRLPKDKFISLIKEPSLQFISHDQIIEWLDNGAILVDVRPPDEYTKNHLPNSINAPFFSLRMQIKSFDKTKPVIVVCADGRTSEAAAFLLLRHKFSAIIVSGGMTQVPENEVTSTMDFEHVTESGTENSIDFVAKDDSESGQTAENSVNNNDEHEVLEIENLQLKLTVQKLTEEKQELEKKYRILYKQTGKLKAILDSLKKGNENS